MKVNVIGLGYIGLPTALSLAAGGLDVVGTDKNAALVESLRRGTLTFEEKGLPELFARAREALVRFESAAVPADVYIVAVPTPYDARSKKIDPKYVESAVRDVVAVAPKGAVIAVESTISPGRWTASCARSSRERGLHAGAISTSRMCQSVSSRAIWSMSWSIITAPSAWKTPRRAKF